MSVDRPLVRAPELPSLSWLNAPQAMTLADLRGRVVLLHMWDYTCINCLRTLPYVRAWWDRYENAGLTILGVHTPEFSFAHHQKHVAAAAGRLGIGWPILLDNDQRLWTALANRYWPTFYLVDGKGYLRYSKAGEGDYGATEQALQELLREIDPVVSLPAHLDPLTPEDSPGAVCLPHTPELQSNSLGNSNALGAIPEILEQGRFYLEGTWEPIADGLTLVESPGAIVLPFRAASAFAVLAPGSDPSVLPAKPVRARLEVDGRDLGPDHFGDDAFSEDGRTWMRIDAPRLYSLARGLDPSEHVLRLSLDEPGFTFYAFSFGACLAAPTPSFVPLQEAPPC